MIHSITQFLFYLNRNLPLLDEGETIERDNVTLWG
jgi:hypothetical protein